MLNLKSSSGPVPKNSLWRPEDNLIRPRLLSRSHTFITLTHRYDKLPHWRQMANSMLKEATFRWPEAEPLEFAYQFIEWNNISRGIQRVDACRTNKGELLLVELEDLNPYLSLLELDPDIRGRFIQSLIRSLQKTLDSLA